MLLSAGDSYPSEDGCNTCNCVETPEGDLLPSCTRQGCPEDSDTESDDVTEEDDSEEEDDSVEEDECTVNGVRYEPGSPLQYHTLTSKIQRYRHVININV